MLVMDPVSTSPVGRLLASWRACLKKKIGLTPSATALLATRTPTVDDFRGHPSESKTARGATLAGVLHGFEYSYVCTRKKSHPWIPLSFSKPQCGFCLRKQTPRRFPHEAFSMFSEPHSIALPAPSGAFRKAGCGSCTHARAVRRIVVSIGFTRSRLPASVQASR